MVEYIEFQRKLRVLKGSLVIGDMRLLAKRMEVYPARISDAYDGFVRNTKFLAKLVAETEALLRERESVTT